MSFDVGDFIKVEKDGAVFEGHVINGDAGYITVKMTGGGYVAGFLENEVRAELIRAGDRRMESRIENKYGQTGLPAHDPSLKNISVLTLGGTIGCYYDSELDAEAPMFTAEDMIAEAPELAGYANIKGRPVFTLLSENLGPEHWQEIAKAVYEEIRDGADGVIVTCGTDTMSDAASAVSFMVETPVPIVFVGAQRSPDRPGSDNHMNLICAARAALSDIAEVMVVMHATLSDDYCYAHRAVRSRKMHTSRRNTFRSISVAPIAEIEYKKEEIRITSDYVRRGEKELRLISDMDTKCAIVKFFPGASPDILNYFIEAGYRSLVIEGVGLGHVSESWIPMLDKADKAGIPVFMTSQCLGGRVGCNVYETGHLMKDAGITECEDILTEVAYIKLMWLMGQGIYGADLKKRMLVNDRGELTWRHEERMWF